VQFADFSPPKTPSLDQQRDALKKGLGRAIEWASRRVLDDESLLEACLQNWKYDRDSEETRGDCLWNMVRAVYAVDRFRVPILHALYQLADDFVRHSLLMSAIEVLEHTPVAVAAQLGIIGYASTPCALCRHNMLRYCFAKMQHRNGLPQSAVSMLSRELSNRSQFRPRPTTILPAE
jgi:hypothetical protein